MAVGGGGWRWVVMGGGASGPRQAALASLALLLKVPELQVKGTVRIS